MSLYINGRARELDIREIGNLLPFEFAVSSARQHIERLLNRHQVEVPASDVGPAKRQRAAVAIDVRADGRQQVVSISPYRAETSLYKPKRAITSTLSRGDTLSSSTEAFEAVTEDSPPTFAFKTDFAGIGLSLLNKRLVEVVYLTLQGLRLEYTQSETSRGVSLACEVIQLDNQLQEGLYPVVLQPSPLPKKKNGALGAPPVVQLSFIVLNDQGAVLDWLAHGDF